MASYRLWLHPVHRRNPHGPLHIKEMLHASSHDERLAVLREVCCEVSTRTGTIDTTKLTEVVVHPDALVARSEVVGKPLQLPLRLSQVCEYDIEESSEEQSDCALGFIAYASPLKGFAAQGQDEKVLATTQGEVWVLVVTEGASGAPPANKRGGYILSQALNALIDRGAFAGETSAFEAINDRKAKGGFGTVQFYRRKHDTNGRVYAGKLLHGKQASVACAESDYLLAAQGHPNIVAFFGTFCFMTTARETRWMIVTEGHAGGDIESRVRRLGVFPERQALQVSSDVLKALSHLHNHQIIHRDVKPANVVLASDGRAVLIDMGLAVFLSETERRKKTCGTPGFTAPEIYLRRGCQYKSDVFGCGAFLYYIASGMAPFAAASKNETMKLNARAHVNFDDPRFLLIAPHTIELIRCMLQKKPSQRPNARTACNTITVVLEMTSPAALPGEAAPLPRHDSPKSSTASDHASSSTRQSLKDRMRAFSSLKTDDMLSSFSSASSTRSSVCSSVSGRQQKPETKASKQNFFLKARGLLGRARQMRTTTEVTPFTGIHEIR